jgi:hypothetical protein
MLLSPRFYFEPQFFKAQGKVKPETRLPMSVAGAFAFPVRHVEPIASAVHQVACGSSPLDLPLLVRVDSKSDTLGVTTHCQLVLRDRRDVDVHAFPHLPSAR